VIILAWKGGLVTISITTEGTITYNSTLIIWHVRMEKLLHTGLFQWIYVAIRRNLFGRTSRHFFFFLPIPGIDFTARIEKITKKDHPFQSAIFEWRDRTP
jgi:hypothetical protein